MTDVTQTGGAGESGRVFVLPAVMTIETVETLAAEFKQWAMAESATLTLDASQVEAITTPGLQLIVSLEKTVGSQGGLLSVRGGRGAFVDAFRHAGLESLLK